MPGGVEGAGVKRACGAGGGITVGGQVVGRYSVEPRLLIRCGVVSATEGDMWRAGTPWTKSIVGCSKNASARSCVWRHEGASSRLVEPFYF